MSARKAEAAGAETGKTKPQKRPEEFVRNALELGAKGAKLIFTNQVFTGEWVRIRCQYGCGAYGSSRNCPPHSPTPERTRRILDEYRVAILIHGDRTTDIRTVVVKLEREIFLAGYYKAFAYACGPCQLCDKCDPAGPCRHEDKSRPAMEACGMDVFATARAAGFPIEVVTAPGCAQNYYGLVLVE
jgi:predicted metal-binding protein